MCGDLHWMLRYRFDDKCSDPEARVNIQRDIDCKDIHRYVETVAWTRVPRFRNRHDYGGRQLYVAAEIQLLGHRYKDTDAPVTQTVRSQCKGKIKQG
jgi:hypothetical protein